MSFLTTRAGYIPLSSIDLIEYPDADDRHVIHYSLGSGPRETSATAAAVSALLDRFDDDEG